MHKKLFKRIQCVKVHLHVGAQQMAIYLHMEGPCSGQGVDLASDQQLWSMDQQIIS